MKTAATIGLKDVQAVYGGAEGDLWELVMGEQIHIGGFQSSMGLAERAGIEPGMRASTSAAAGAGMRFLVRFRNVAQMHGVDATATVVERGRRRCQAEGSADRISFTLGDACHRAARRPAPISSGAKTPGATWWTSNGWWRRLPASQSPDGVIAFTDWVTGPNPWPTESRIATSSS